MKRCYDCGQEKPLSDFYKNASKPDGLTPACKECHRAWRKDHYRRNAESVSASNRAWDSAHPDLMRSYSAKSQRKRYATKKHTGIFHVYHLVSRAVKAGILTPEPCRICGGRDVEAHHEDYQKPLDVLWYCRRHHARLHAITGGRMHTLNDTERPIAAIDGLDKP
jgi:hypothetical protein